MRARPRERSGCNRQGHQVWLDSLCATQRHQAERPSASATACTPVRGLLSHMGQQWPGWQACPVLGTRISLTRQRKTGRTLSVCDSAADPSFLSPLQRCKWAPRAAPLRCSPPSPPFGPGHWWGLQSPGGEGRPKGRPLPRPLSFVARVEPATTCAPCWWPPEQQPPLGSAEGSGGS